MNLTRGNILTLQYLIRKAEMRLKLIRSAQDKEKCHNEIKTLKMALIALSKILIKQNWKKNVKQSRINRKSGVRSGN